MADDRASRRLEVDEQGIPRRISNDPWSQTTSRSAHHWRYFLDFDAIRAWRLWGERMLVTCRSVWKGFLYALLPVDRPEAVHV